jgi:hypothetical protein
VVQPVTDPSVEPVTDPSVELTAEPRFETISRDSIGTTAADVKMAETKICRTAERRILTYGPEIFEFLDRCTGGVE